MQFPGNKIIFGGVVLLFLFGCQKSQVPKVENSSPNLTKTKELPTAKEETEKVPLPLRVSKLANNTSIEIEKVLGKPKEIKLTEDNGEYRLYEVLNEPKGLAVRFYGGKAKSFNLILTEPIPTSKGALKKVFDLDVGKVLPTKDSKEPLSEKYEGIFGGTKFSKISAKKDEKGKGFIFVLAEVER